MNAGVPPSLAGVRPNTSTPLGEVDPRGDRLQAVDHEVVVLSAHGRLAAKHVVPALWLGHRERQERLARGDPLAANDRARCSGPTCAIAWPIAALSTGIHRIRFDAASASITTT